jgi:RimJ/RimL family protein N-acetyltransferase
MIMKHIGVLEENKGSEYLIKLESFSKANIPLFVQHLKNGWDWSLSGKDSLTSFVDAFFKDDAFRGYWVTYNNEPHGIVSFRQYSEPGEVKTVSLGIYIHKDKRGKGLARTVLVSSATAMQKMNIPLIATVHEDNKRSLNMIRAATGMEGTHIYEPSKNRNAWFFNLDKNNFVEPNTGEENKVKEYINNKCIETLLSDKKSFDKLLLSFK